MILNRQVRNDLCLLFAFGSAAWARRAWTVLAACALTLGMHSSVSAQGTGR